MVNQGRIPVICIVGPTASGKSALAQKVALEIGGEVVSADSMQIYRGMDIGTGKVPEARRIVKHYGLDLVDPGEPYSAALFQRYAREQFAAIGDSGKVPILCGGTGFYVRAAMDDYDFPEGEQQGNPIRERYNDLARELGAHEVWLMLDRVDPRSANVIPENDVKRVVRALELHEQGQCYADLKEALASIPQYWPGVFVGLSVEPSILRARIRDRVDEMVDEGLVDEVKGLLNLGFRDGLTAPQAIGYKEIVAALDGECTLEDAVESIKVATSRYAKRQRTWFRKDARIHWIDANDNDLERMTGETLEIVRENLAHR